MMPGIYLGRPHSASLRRCARFLRIGTVSRETDVLFHVKQSKHRFCFT